MRKNWQLKFGIGFMLFATTVVAGYFFGLKRGDEVRIANRITTRTYSLEAFLKVGQPVDEQYAAIESFIQDTIAPASWISRGGMATSMVYPSNQSLVITQTNSEHKKITELLDALLQNLQGEVTTVEYDLSAIVDAKAEKSLSDQMDAVCAIAADRFSGLGYPAIDLVSNPDRLIVTARTNSQMHDELNLYFGGLREARELITEVDL